MNWGADVVKFGAQNVSFGMLVASTLVPRGTIERFRGTWEHKKGDLGVWISIDLGGCRDRHLKFFANVGRQTVFFGMLVCT